MKNSFLQPSWKNKGMVPTRFGEIGQYMLGKKVLDVGCAVGFRKPNWLHGLIKEKASYVKGLDIDHNAVLQIAQSGFNVIHADAQNFELNERFDVIHAGELIEHLDNFHGFLQSCKQHMTPEGILIITTPNAMRAGNFFYSLMGGLRVNKEHTCWFCDKTMTALLERNGFIVQRIGYLKHDTQGVLRKFLAGCLRLFLPSRVAWNTLMAVATVK